MRTFIRHVFLLVLLLKICHINYASSRATSDERQDDDVQKSNLRHVVGNMIGVNVDGVKRGGGQRLAVDVESMFTGRSRSLPRYIQRLYERYRRGDVVHGADTVRSINAELGSCIQD